MENWVEVKVTVSTEDLERTSAIVSLTVPYGIYIEDYSDLEAEAWEIANIDLIDEELLQKDRSKGIVHVYIPENDNPTEAVSFIESRLSAERITYALEIFSCNKEDWENNWKQYFKPVAIGKKLLIHPVWIDEYNPMGRFVLHLEPGIAFGTGAHETTRLCLEELENHIHKDSVMLDVGCGSGILSAAGMLLGAKSVVGVDIDELAVKVAVSNGALNGFSEPSYKMIRGNLTDHVSGKYSVITANIVADAIIELTPQIKRFMLPGAVYIVSGIIDARADEVCGVLAANGFRVVEKRENKGWVCLACKTV